MMNAMGRAAFARRIAQSNLWRLSRPYKVLLALTYRCNSRCQTCGIWKGKPAAEPALDDIRTFFSKNSYLSWVNLTGGEIFLRRDLPAVLEEIHDGCKGLCLLNFATNGLQPQRAERVLAEMPAHPLARTIVTVSVDGPGGLNDRIRGVRGGFRRSVETFQRLRALQRKNLEVYFGLTLSDRNAGMLLQTYEALKREIPALRPADLHVNVAHSSAHYFANAAENVRGSDRIAEDVRLHLSRLPKMTARPVQLLERSYLRHLQDYLRTGRPPVTCQALSASCFINPAWDVYPCIVFDRPLGNLGNADFDLGKIWAKKESCSLRQGIRRGDCPGCWLACEAYQSIMGGLL